jgi:hypothetical protein
MKRPSRYIYTYSHSSRLIHIHVDAELIVAARRVSLWNGSATAVHKVIVQALLVAKRVF